MISAQLQNIFTIAIEFAKNNNHEYITLEHIFLILLDNKRIINICQDIQIDTNILHKELAKYVLENTPIYPLELQGEDPLETISLTQTIQEMVTHIQYSSKEQADVEDMFIYILKNEDAYCSYLLKQQGFIKVDILEHISHGDDQNLDNDTKKESKKKESVLSQNSIELVALAKKDLIDPVINREKELERTIEILARRKKNNPLFIGETGVGKTAIANALALKIASKNVPSFLEDAKIYSLDMGSMVAGTKYRGDFEKKFKSILKDISKKKNAILFIDEIHTVVGAGSVGNSSMDASNILKPLLSSGKLKVIGATTYEEYRTNFSKDKAFSRRFAKVEISEPSIEDCITIIEGLKPKYEEFHNIKYTKEALVLAVELSSKFINDRFLPDSAIDIIDEVGAKVKLNKTGNNIKVTKKDVEETVALVANIPPKTATKTDLVLLKNLQKNLQKRVFGQDEAIKTIVEAIQINKSGMTTDHKPIASFLFTGSTGVGKTEVAKELASTLGIYFEKFDMSEYSEAHSISRLIGAPAGYVGHEKGGLLTETIKKHPHCVLLLDEIEKAHSDLMNLLLQVMDNATLTDNNGVKSDFSNVILIMTSNLGAKESNIMGFAKDNSLNEDKAVKTFFSPEFRNRLDEIVKFNSLKEHNLIKIVTKFILDIQDQLSDKNITISITQNAKKELAKKGYDKLMGARPLSRVISKEIKLPLSHEVLFGKLKNGGSVKIDFKDNKFLQHIV